MPHFQSAQAFTLNSSEHSDASETLPEKSAVELAEESHLLLKQKKGLLILSAIALFGVSFLYGIWYGLHRNLGQAQALRLRSIPLTSYDIPTSIALPPGVTAIPVGREISLNGRESEMVNFVSYRGVKETMQDLVAIWERQGMRAVGMTSGVRGVAMAFDQRTSRRFSAITYKVEPKVRKFISDGRPTMGYITTVDLSKPVTKSAAKDDLGQLPGIPIPPGGKVTSTFASRDFGGQSHTGFYTAPGNPNHLEEFFRRELTGTGWIESPVPHNSVPNGFGNALEFERDGKAATIMLSPVSHEIQPNATDSTLAFIVIRPKDADDAF